MGNSSSTHDLFFERFPLLGLQMGSWEAKEMFFEELPPILPGKEDAFYFFGLHPGVYAKCKDWLKGDKKLIFLEDEPGIIASFLEKKEAFEILENPQVHIELLGDLEDLARRFPLKRIEVAGLKSKKGLKKLRLELLRKTALSHGQHTDRLYGYQPFYNFVQNLKRLPNSFYANGLKGAFAGVPAIVCGAGPSLESTLETMRTLEDRALVIAGGSTLAALSSKGILPHFGMALDPNLEEYRRLKNSFAFEVPLLYSTRVHPGIFQCANGPFGYMRSGIGGLLELWIEEELGLQDPLIGQWLAPETISVTGICVAFAEFLGCNPILLNGIDMAYTGGVRYASGVDEGEALAFDLIDQEKSAADRIVRKKGVYSAVRWVMESESISQFAKKHKKTKFINTTVKGLGFKGIKYEPLEEAVKGFEKQNLRARVWEKISHSPMPTPTKDTLIEQMDLLRASLKRVIEHLEILAGEKKGSKALSEIELEEEMARLYLFYDIKQLFTQEATFWRDWLELARRYEKYV